MNRIFYSVYGPYIDQFIELKNRLGYKYKDAGFAFSSFDRLAWEKNTSDIAITKEFVDEWSTKRPNESEKTRCNRIQHISQFARFLSDLGFRSYIPKTPQVKSTYIPYIFSKDEMKRIFNVCDKLSPTSRNHNSSVFAVPVLIRLLYGTGIRISEALYLACSDINLKDRFITLRCCKNGMDRIVPVSDSLANACNAYKKYRDLTPFIIKEDRFFIRPNGFPLSIFTVYKWFRRIIYIANISHGGRGFGPRLHDLRHTFSVHSLVSMSESGLDLYYSLPTLSTYLGHQSLEATDRYVRLTAEMYPDLIKKSSDISSSAFPLISVNAEDYEAD